MSGSHIQDVARRLVAAERSGMPVEPVAPLLGAGDLAAAYAVQAELVAIALLDGRRPVGRKIGLTSKAVQAQLGVDQPDYGALFADMEIEDGGTLAMGRLIQPRIEAELAFVLGRDLTCPDLAAWELMGAVDHVLPALEIVDSRIAGWRIGIVDTIADNGSSARFVTGANPRRLTDLALDTCAMTLSRNEETVSQGRGAACLGHPLKAALWLARTMAASEAPLRAGDLILTGALGPMVDVRAGDLFRAEIDGFGAVSVEFEA